VSDDTSRTKPANDEGPAPSWRQRASAALTSLGLGVLGTLPFAWVLTLTPMTRDAAIWLDRSDWQSPKLQEWLLETQHFNVGFRPVTGLSYLVNEVLGGGVLAYRLTDFGLHLGAVGLVHALVRRWAPDRSPWAATAGAAVLALHPMVGIVLPHLARRGYALASTLAMLGLWLLSRNQLAASVVGIAALAAGALANEAAYVAFGVATLALASRRRFQELGAMGLTIAALLAWRISVIGGLGGYAAATDRAGRVGTIGLATWSTLLPVGMPSGGAEGALLPSAPFLAASFAIVAALVVAVVQAVRQPEPAPAHQPTWNRPVLWALAWLAGLTAVYLPNGVWFPRQVYMLVPPLAVLVGLLAGLGLGRPGPQRWPARIAAGAVLLLTLGRVTVFPHATHRTAWEQTDRVTTQLMAAAKKQPKKQEIVLVLPFAKRGGQAALKAREGAKRRRQDPLGTRVSYQWASGRIGRRRLDLAAMYLHDPFHEGPVLKVEAVDGHDRTWRLTLTDPGAHWSPEADLDDSLDGASLTVTVPEGAMFWVDDGIEGRWIE